MSDEIVLCAASAYEQKFYLNPEFDSLPENIRQELQIMCVLYTEDVGGILMLVFDGEGNLELKVDHEENDFFFDEIGSVLKIKDGRVHRSPPGAVRPGQQCEPAGPSGQHQR